MFNLSETIYTPRLQLIQMSPEFLAASLSDSEKARRLVDFEISNEWFKEKKLIQLRLNQGLLRSIVRIEDKKMVGHFNAHGFPGMDHLKQYSQHGLEIGYTIYSDYRRNGYASEAIEGFTEVLKKNPPVSVVLSIGVSNSPSLQLAKKLGYLQVGSAEDQNETELVFIKHY